MELPQSVIDDFLGTINDSDIPSEIKNLRDSLECLEDSTTAEELRLNLEDLDHACSNLRQQIARARANLKKIARKLT
jgi:hypothetical protein